VNCSLDHDVILTSAAERKELDNRISNQLASSRLLRNIAVGEKKRVGWDRYRPGRENEKIKRSTSKWRSCSQSSAT
jgi:hypothetical protein